MIELAPHHKLGLSIANPVIPASGCFGYGPEYASLVDLSALGAVVTNPVTLRPRRGNPQPRLVETSAGLVLGTGAQNPGVRRVIQGNATSWKRMGIPVIVHLADSDPSDLARTARALESTGAVAGFELGLLDNIDPREAARMVDAARESELPLLVKLPLYQATQLAPICVDAGADGLVASAPPPAAARHPSGQLVTGHLHGPALHPLTLAALLSLRTWLDLPLIACGGVHNVPDALAFLDAGADAVQIDSAIFRDPSLLDRLAAELG